MKTQKSTPAKKTEKKEERCPRCGYCEHCGQSRMDIQTYPYPYYYYWPSAPYVQLDGQSTAEPQITWTYPTTGEGLTNS